MGDQASKGTPSYKGMLPLRQRWIKTVNLRLQGVDHKFGIGFASFITGEIGQKIILKAGLLPKYQSERIIELSPIQDIKVIR